MSRLRLAVCLAVLLAPAAALAQTVGGGYWRTDGNKIVDSNGNPVRFSGVNWNGFESGNHVVHGLWGGGRNMLSLLDQIQSLGFNLIRLPFSGDTLVPGRMPQNIDYSLNPELQGMSAIEIMDFFVAECGKRGIRIILDYHRIQAGHTPELGLWFIPNSSYTEALWIDNWKKLVQRYVNNPTVVGVDLFNEVHADGSHPGPFWDADGANEPYNWRTAARRCAEALLSVNSNLLICIQGMHGYGSETSWWGANHMGIKDHPITLSVPNRIVYSVHDYGPNVWDQPWHNDPAFPNNLPGFWDRQWGFVHNEGLGPIWIGEWGSKLDNTRENQWATALRDYIQAKGLSWTWWCWTPNSHDTGGILTDDWNTVHQSKMNHLSPVMYPGFAPPGGGGGTPPPPSGQAPYGGTARGIESAIQAEDFDEGGEGVAYHDTDAANSGGQYRSTGVDIEASSDAGGGYNVGWLAPGEWLEFTVDVGTAGTYTLEARVASALNGGAFHVEFGGVDTTGPIAAPSTGGWQAWTTVTATDVALGAGTQVMRVVFDGGSFNLNWLKFTLVAADPSAGGGGGGAGAAGPGGGGDNDNGCGATGAEVLLLLGLMALRRR